MVWRNKELAEEDLKWLLKLLDVVAVEGAARSSSKTMIYVLAPDKRKYKITVEGA